MDYNGDDLCVRKQNLDERELNFDGVFFEMDFAISNAIGAFGKQFRRHCFINWNIA